jgi:hypothetical protein
MATTQEVRLYLAYWFQLGKRVVVPATNQQVKPNPVLCGEAYSAEFEACWQSLLAGPDAYLEGTEQSIADLLEAEWDLVQCARCQVPVPLRVGGLSPTSCPCADLPGWPNLDLPIPHAPVNNKTYLTRICNHLFETD